MADKFGLRAWTINLRTWIFGFAYLVFKTTCIDAEKPLREGAFSFTRTMLFPLQDKRNTRDKAKGLLGRFGGVYRRAGRHSLLPERHLLRPVEAHLLHPHGHQKSAASYGEIKRLAPRDTSIVKSLLSLLYKSIT